MNNNISDNSKSLTSYRFNIVFSNIVLSVIYWMVFDFFDNHGLEILLAILYLFAELLAMAIINQDSKGETTGFTVGMFFLINPITVFVVLFLGSAL